MKKILGSVTSIIIKPKNSFTALMDSGDLKTSFAIIVVNVLAVSTYIFYHKNTAPLSAEFSENYNIAFLMSIMFIATVGTILSLVIETGWMQIFFKAMKVKSKISVVFSAVAYSYVPILLRNIFAAIFKKTYDVGSLLGFLNDKHEGYANIAHSDWLFNLFGLMLGFWSVVLIIIGISVIGSISYRKSMLVVLPYFMITILINILVRGSVGL